MVSPSILAVDVDEGAVLAKAVARVCEIWELGNADLGRIVGVSPPTVSRLRAGRWTFARESKPFELAQFLVRIFRSLDAIVGSDDVAARRWLRGEQTDLGHRPIDKMQTVRGLIEVADLLDAYRARV